MTRPVSIPFARLGLRAFAALTLVGLLSMLLGPALVRADTVTTDVVNSTLGELAIEAEQVITYSYSVTDPADPVNGCNLTGSGSSLVLNVSSSDPSVATVSPTQITLVSCNDSAQVTATGVGAGTVSILLSVASVTTNKDGVTASNFNVASATVSGEVASSNTAPSSVAVTGFADGATYELGIHALPTAGCVAEDAEDGTVFPDPSITDARNVFGLGSVTVFCSYSDGEFSIGPVSASYTVIDTIAPGITFLGKDPTANLAGWNNVGLVTLSWSCSDGGSGVASPVTQQSSTEGTISLTGTCMDNAGISATDTQSVSIDTQLPVITAAADRSANSNGWYNADVTVSFECSDPTPGSGLAQACPSAVAVTADTVASGQSISGSVSDVADNIGQSNVINVKLDKTAPTLVASSVYTAGTWTNQNVTVSFACNDVLSGPAGNPADQEFTAEGSHSITSVICLDNASNESTAASFGSINIDKTAPTGIAFVGGGLTDGATYYAGYNVPAGPTSCTADGGLSGLQGCVLSGTAGTAAGSYTLTATATDRAGNQSQATLSYTVGSLTFTGFFSPVDMGITNTLKGGNAVPLKFRVFAGNTEVTDASLFRVKYNTVSCTTLTTLGTDELEVVTTGGTSLRYENGQFITNWKTPTGAACYKVVVTLADGTTVISPVAYFQTRK